MIYASLALLFGTVLVGGYATWRWSWWRVQLVWYDAWIGAYFDRERQVLYICPLPFVVVEIPLP
jgi:hypothetical protein